MAAPISLAALQKKLLDERQITHLICARLKYDRYDFLGRNPTWEYGKPIWSTDPAPIAIADAVILLQQKTKKTLSECRAGQVDVAQFFKEPTFSKEHPAMKPKGGPVVRVSAPNGIYLILAMPRLNDVQT